MQEAYLHPLHPPTLVRSAKTKHTTLLIVKWNVNKKHGELELVIY